jgi:hypothetical protein
MNVTAGNELPDRYQQCVKDNIGAKLKISIPIGD